jgi:hypothetical protein
MIVINFSSKPTRCSSKARLATTTTRGPENGLDRLRRQVDSALAAHVDTAAARHRPALPSPCCALLPSPARSPRSATSQPTATDGSLPSPPHPAPASFPVRIEPGSRGSWSIFGCRAVVIFQLPSTRARIAVLSSHEPCAEGGPWGAGGGAGLATAVTVGGGECAA